MKHVLILTISLLFSNLMAEMLKIPQEESLVLPLPLPYERKEVSNTELIDFISQSQPGNQSIIIFGANWCPDCRILEGTLQLPTVRKFMDQNFSIMHIDLGKYDLNMSLMELIGIPSQEGIPRVIIFNENGKPLNLDSSDRWRAARDDKQQDIFNYFQKFVLH